MSGYKVVQRWIGSRTEKGIGRAATQPHPLDKVKVRGWLDDWNYELIEVLKAVDSLVSLQTEQEMLLNQILNAEKIASSAFPLAPLDMTKPPGRGASQPTLGLGELEG